MLEEILFCLEQLIFETNIIGRNAYYFLRRLIHDYKVDSNHRIKEWQWRVTQLNSYILYVPSDSLENCGASKVQFTEIDMCKILDYALPNSYCKKLFGIDWIIYEQEFIQTINKLQAIKPEIKAKVAKAKIGIELADIVYSNKGTKRNNNAKTKTSDTKKTTYKTCDKQYKGEYWKLKNSINAGRNNHNSGNKVFDKKQMRVINQMFKAHSSAKKEESNTKSESINDEQNVQIPFFH